MTVAELIEELKRMPAHLPVLVESVDPTLAYEPVFSLPAERCHASVTCITMKYNHVIIDATGDIL